MTLIQQQLEQLPASSGFLSKQSLAPSTQQAWFSHINASPVKLPLGISQALYVVMSQLLSRGNMKQMSSELVDREERKHSLISKDTTSPCWISIQHSSSATAPSPAAGGEWCQSAARGGEGWPEGHQESSLLCHRLRIHLWATKNR